MKKERLFYYAGLATLVSVVLYNHFFSFFGHLGSDDMYYALLAKQFNDGTLQLANDHYAYRWGLLLPAALCYKVFGINDFSSALPAAVSTLLCLLLVHFFTGHWNYPYRLLAAALFVLHQWTLFYFDKLMPDTVLMLWLFIVFILVTNYRKKKEHTTLKTVYTGFGIGFFLILAVVTKETVVLFLPLLAVLAFTDMLKKRFTFFWMMSFACTVLWVLVYFFILKVLTGSFTSRFGALTANEYFNPCSYDQLPFINTLERIGYELWVRWIDSGQIVAVLLLVPALTVANLRSFLNNERKENVLLYSAVLLVLCANFMSTSLHAYIPMCPDPRHFLYLSPILALAGASALQQYIMVNKRQWLFSILVFVVTLTAWKVNSESFPELWIVLVIGIVFTVFIKSKMYREIAIVTVMFVALLARDCRYMRYTASVGYKDQQELVQQHVLNDTNGRTIVYTDLIGSRSGSYYTGFDSTQFIFASFKQAKVSDSARFQNRYIIINPFTSYACGENINDMPAGLKEKAEKATLVVKVGNKELRKIE